MIDTLVARKRCEDAMLTDLWYRLRHAELVGKKAKKYLADERVKTHSPLLFGKKVMVPLPGPSAWSAVGLELPAHKNRGCDPRAHSAGTSVVMKPSEVTPLTSLLVAEAAAAVGILSPSRPARERARR